jgi:ubiquinol-cytochrome c reductase iron-sulfur subunit
MIARIGRWLVALAVLAYGRLRRRRREEAQAGRDRDTPHTDDPAYAHDSAGRIVPPGPRSPRAELAVVLLLLVAGLCAAGFVVTYGIFSPAKLPNQLLGACIAGALLAIALALVVVARRLVVTEELEEDYPQEDPQAQKDIVQVVRESGSRLTRRRLLFGAATAAGGAVGVAGLAPLLSLGPLWDTTALLSSPWYRGRRLVDLQGRPILAADVEEETFYTAFPDGANFEDIASPLVVVRLTPSALRLPAGRETWAPQGIVAYSKICTHAGCAIALYRKPRFRPVEPEPALVCPCHYSTFNPATGAQVIFGPAGRPLPQLPLMIDEEGHLRAAGNFSGPVGPGWWSVRSGRIT